MKKKKHIKTLKNWPFNYFQQWPIQTLDSNSVRNVYLLNFTISFMGVLNDIYHNIFPLLGPLNIPVLATSFCEWTETKRQ